MLFKWFDARNATAFGIALADQFAARSAPQKKARRRAKHSHRGDPVTTVLQRAAHQLRSLPLNFYKKAKLANAFQWRLVEKGLEATVAAELTEKLVRYLSLNQSVSSDVPGKARRTTSTTRSRF